MKTQQYSIKEFEVYLEGSKREDTEGVLGLLYRGSKTGATPESMRAAQAVGLKEQWNLVVNQLQA